MISAVDANILLDLLIPNSPRQQEAFGLLNVDIADRLLICDIVYGEIAGSFSQVDVLDTFLTRNRIEVEALSPSTLFEAGQLWRRYTRQRGTSLLCSSCGARSRPACSRCGEVLTSRQHMVADFIVGAHAMARADRLLTRDRGYYRTYFPELRLDS